MSQKPYWPTFRGAPLHTSSFERDKDGKRWHQGVERCLQISDRIGTLSGVIYISQGYQWVCTTPNGGLGNGSRNDAYPTISFERTFWVKRAHENRKFPVYLLGWIGGYEKGSILHVGWQYPHAASFCPDGLLEAARQNYRQIAEAVYGGEAPDSDVRKFIEGIQL